jgi:hypothetical protein
VIGALSIASSAKPHPPHVLAVSLRESWTQKDGFPQLYKSVFLALAVHLFFTSRLTRHGCTNHARRCLQWHPYIQYGTAPSYPSPPVP